MYGSVSTHSCKWMYLFITGYKTETKTKEIEMSVYIVDGVVYTDRLEALAALAALHDR